MVHIEKLVPEIYRESRDFRVFLKLLDIVINSQKYDIDNWTTLYDPMLCPNEFLPLLSDIIGYRYDNKLSIAENRIIMSKFNSLIKNKGSEIGLRLAAVLSMNAQLASDPKSQEYINAINQLQYLELFYDYETATISIYYPHDIKKVRDLFKYVRPVGSFIHLINADFPEPESDLGIRTSVDFDIERFTDGIDYRGSDLEEASNLEPGLKINLGQITRGDFIRIEVDTYADLLAYDTRNIALGMLATVNHDETHSNNKTFYAWELNSSTGDYYWDYLGDWPYTTEDSEFIAKRNMTDRLLSLTHLNNYEAVTVEDFTYTPSMVQELKNLIIDGSKYGDTNFNDRFDFDEDGKLTVNDLAYLRKLLLGIMTYSEIKNEVNNS